MSGGSWDYAHSKVRNMAQDLREPLVDQYGVWAEPHQLRIRLAEHMEALADVMKAIEWADSADTAADSWIEPTMKFLGLVPCSVCEGQGKVIIQADAEFEETIAHLDFVRDLYRRLMEES